MRSPYTQLYLHCVWATWDRLPLITPQIEPQLYTAIHAKCKEIRCEPIAIGGIENHVHLLVRFPTTLAVATLVKEVKRCAIASNDTQNHTKRVFQMARRVRRVYGQKKCGGKSERVRLESENASRREESDRSMGKV